MAGAADFVAPRPLAVTVGNYLLMYADGRFARHPRFRYFALNTDVRWRSLQAGRISASTHMMPSSFSSIVLTWLLFYHCSSITSTETQRVYRHVRSCSPPLMPCIRLVIIVPALRPSHSHLLYCTCSIPSFNCTVIIIYNYYLSR